MGANTRNRYGISRRFAICYQMHQDAIYRELVDNYQVSKITAQNGKEEHLKHVANIKALHSYLAECETSYNIKHR